MASPERFLISGLGGQRALNGCISVRGAKNAALKAFAASALFKDNLTIHNVPDIEDVKEMCKVLEGIGSKTRKVGDSSYEISALSKPAYQLPRVAAKRLRASIVLIGPLLARFGKVSFPHPGGCLLGARPIDFFLNGFKRMGAKLSERGEWYELEAPSSGLRAAEIFFKRPSVTVTETLMISAVFARGKTVLKNAAMEPEIVSLASFLNKSGARISGAGTPTITITGGKNLLSAGNRAFETPPDRIEAGSFLILGALAARELKITDCNPTHLEAIIDVLRFSGSEIEIEKNGVLTVRNRSRKPLNVFNVITREYPGFPTDLQAPITVYLTQANGEALVFETIFEGRFRYIDELLHMGADIIACDPHRVVVRGPALLSGKDLSSPDIRAGLAYVIAAIIAKGDSVIHNVHYIDRGYERIEERLQNIGVKMIRK